MALHEGIDFTADQDAGLSLDQRAAAILHDMAAALPYDGGDSLDAFLDELIDEGEALRGIVRVLLSDPIAAQRMLSIKATHFAYAEARR